ncbi:MAG: hypothetical protein ACO3FO_06360 [Candidatus Nanopelagicaceae bacterium]
MAKKVKEEVVEVVNVTSIQGNVSIKIIKDTQHLKVGEVYKESGDIAAILVAKGIAEVL